MKHALPLSFFKMSGAGNTFTLIDARKSSAWSGVESSTKTRRSEIAKRICDKVNGLSTDGILFIEDGTDGLDYNWDFYNSDGSTAEMCGNAARCAARFCFEEIVAEKKRTFTFKTGAGKIETEVLADGRIRVRMPAAKIVNPKMELKTKSSALEKFYFVNTGVPHLVQKIHDFADVEALKDMAREVRSHEDLKPAGSNVTFYVPEQNNFVRAVTFERGVEDYTLACGTGAVAAAMAASADSGEKTILVQMPGGLLEVSFVDQDPHPIMVGEAIYIGEFKMNSEVIV